MSSTHCFLRTENRSICHGVVSSEFLINHTFQRKRYISIARTGHFIIDAETIPYEHLNYALLCICVLTPRLLPQIQWKSILATEWSHIFCYYSEADFVFEGRSLLGNSRVDLY